MTALNADSCLIIFFHHSQHLQGRKDAITGFIQVKKYYVPRLFPSKIVTMGSHLL